MAMASNEQDDQANRSSTSVAVDLKANSETNELSVDIKSIPIVNYQPKAKGTTSSTLFDLGIEKSIFIKPDTFHLTVPMLKLWNKDRVNEARDVLKSISPSVMDALDNMPIFIRLKGLECMKGPLAKARVMYVRVEEIGNEGRLLRACRILAFSENVKISSLNDLVFEFWSQISDKNYGLKSVQLFGLVLSNTFYTFKAHKG